MFGHQARGLLSKLKKYRLYYNTNTATPTTSFADPGQDFLHESNRVRLVRFENVLNVLLRIDQLPAGPCQSTGAVAKTQHQLLLFSSRTSAASKSPAS
jgi:hypothetical protein